MTDFERIVCDAFTKILRAYGYRLVRSQPTRVTFDSRDRSVVVQLGAHGSSEVTVGLRSLTADHGPDFSFDEMLEAMTVPIDLRPAGYAVSSEDSLRDLVGMMADLLSKYCGPLLNGDAVAWSRIALQRQVAASEYAKETALRQCLNEAAHAWQQKEWRKYVELLDASRALLSKTDLAKLEYAERRVRSNLNEAHQDS